MSNKITQRDVIRAFQSLRSEARRYANSSQGGAHESTFELDLHDAAMKYARLVRRVARAGRDAR